MTQLRFFTDEDVYGAVAPALRKLGFDAISTPESRRLGDSDESQLQWATHEGRVFVTFNVAHFAHLHSQWMSQGRHHAGVLVSQQRPVGDLLRRLISVGRQLQQEEMRDRLEFLGEW